MFNKIIVSLAFLVAFSPALASAQYGGGGGGGYSAPEPTITPLAGTLIANFSINNGAKSTVSTKITLSLPSTNADQMTISNFADFQNASWEKYSSTKEWILLPESGTKTVYVMFRTASTGKTTKVLSNSVELQMGKTTETVVTTPTQTAQTPSASSITTPSAKKYIFKRFLGAGSKGNDVKQLQILLKELGFYAHPSITGYYGPVTKAAVVKFQKANKLKPYPGWIGPATRKALSK